MIRKIVQRSFQLGFVVFQIPLAFGISLPPRLGEEISGLGRVFLNYDWLVFAENISQVGSNSDPVKNAQLFGSYQVEFLKLEDFENFRETRSFSERTCIYLAPGHHSQLKKLVLNLAQIYDIKSKSNLSPASLFTFIRWPLNGQSDEGIPQLKHRIVNLFSGKLSLNSNVFILIKRAGVVGPPDSSPQAEAQALSIFSISDKTVLQVVQGQCLTRTTSFNPNYERYSFLLDTPRRFNFNKAVVRAASVDTIWDQLIARHAMTNGTLELSGGYAVQLIWDLRDSLNFTIQTVLADGYIGKHPNGTLKGLGAHLYFDLADISLDISYIIPYRIRTLTPLFSVFTSKPTAYFKQPPASKTKNLYSLPFNRSTWILIILPTAISILISVYLFALMGNPVCVKGNENGQLRGAKPKVLAESFFWAISVLCLRGWYANPPSTSSKLIVLTAWTTSIVIVAAYSGAFVAGLVTESVPVKAFSDLILNGFNLLYNPTIYYRNFNTEECPLYDELDMSSNSNNKPSNHCTSDEAGVLKIFEPGFVYVSTYDVFRQVVHTANYTDKDVCAMVSTVPFGNLQVPTTMYVQKGSPFRAMFNLKLLHLMEIGLNDRYIKLIFVKELDLACPDKKTQYRGGLRFDDVYFASLFSIFGILAAFAMFGVELLINQLVKHWNLKLACVI